MTTVRAVALFGLAVFATSCGSHGTVPRGSARIAVVQRPLACCYPEGQVSYARVARADGRDEPVTRSSRGGGTGAAVTILDEHVTPGVYRVSSWQRPCDGNCARLDAPTDRCETLLTLRNQQRVTVRVGVTPGRGCTMTTR